ncbi:hypothetical protein MSAN_02288300 [Mycena sanguinolenta]|uniref:BRCT domain-containing protein n=1 Tax=Mycena sanguinolenta TaxID=230812 RepID=A0A8H6X9I4_9AGAR|nr:hypothetical protein MSAN_02288300 [Mycena sanguinolenta]
MSRKRVQYKQLFRGQYAVFSPHVADIYMRDYVAAGGRIATTAEEMAEVVFCICNDRFDTDFIAQWWNKTFRIVTRTFLYDCIAQGKRLCEETYSWGVDEKDGYKVVPTWKVCKWSGPALPKPEADNEMSQATNSPPRKKLSKDERRAESRGERRPQRSGLLTPAPSIESSAPPHKRRRTSSISSTTSTYYLGGLFEWTAPWR